VACYECSTGEDHAFRLYVAVTRESTPSRVTGDVIPAVAIDSIVWACYEELVLQSLRARGWRPTSSARYFLPPPTLGLAGVAGRRAGLARGRAAHLEHSSPATSQARTVDEGEAHRRWLAGSRIAW